LLDLTWSRIGSVSVVRDITARTQAEVELHRRAKELAAANHELNRFNNAMVGLELRMIELKKQIDDLCVKFGQPPRYRSVRSLITDCRLLVTAPPRRASRFAISVGRATLRVRVGKSPKP